MYESAIHSVTRLLSDYRHAYRHAPKQFRGILMGLPLRKSKVLHQPPQCPLTLCMDLLRGAWAPNVIWYLRAGPRRFGELRHDIPRISARVLSARLREMEARGMITRRLLDTSPASAEYELTLLGPRLLPAIDASLRVGERISDEPGPRRP